MSNEVLKNDTSIALNWADVTAANLYHAQVADVPDFGGTLIAESAVLATSDYAFTDAGANDSKRWWRWRSSADAGTTWGRWQTVGHYWLNSAATADILLTAGTWALFDPDVVADLYTIPTYPMYRISPKQIYRLRDRNRAGNLVSDYITQKEVVRFEFDDHSFCTEETVREFLRYNVEVKTFFLAGYVSNGVDNVPKIWKAQMTDDPEFTMLASGREDFFTGSVGFEEV